MRALRFFGARDLRVENVPVPEPGDGEVLLKTAFCGICGSDLHTFRAGPMAGPGVLCPDRIEPYTVGHEFSGEIVSLGRNCRARRVGERVVPGTYFSCGSCPACRSGLPNACEKIAFLGGPEHDGGFAEYCVLPEEMLFPVPDGLSLEKAACADPLSVGLHAARSVGWRPDSVTVIAGAGSIGLALTAVLKALGAETVVVLQRPSPRQKAAKTLGADLVLDPGADGVREAVRELTGGLGAGFAFETTGYEPNFHLLGSLLRPHGTECVISLWRDPVPVVMNDLVNGERTVTGSNGFRPEEFREVLRILADGRLSTDGYVTKILPLAEAVDKGFLALASPGEKADVKILVDPSR